jgi:hypothetical protein
MKGSSDSDHLVTPCQKQMLLKSGLKPLNMDFPPSSNDENSYVSSVKETCESPLSSWDSEPETDISFVVNYGDAISEGSLEGINLEEKYLEMEQENQFVGVENTDDGLLWQMDNRSYDELLKKFIENEEVLRVSNFKLQLSEQEIIKLKIQIDERENQLGNVREELKLKEEELRKKTAESETQIPHYVNKVANMAEKLGVANEQLKISKDEIAILRKELDSKSYKTRELQDQLKATKENLAKLECAKYFRGEIILKC